jgi:hypothetical protein
VRQERVMQRTMREEDRVSDIYISFISNPGHSSNQ